MVTTPTLTLIVAALVPRLGIGHQGGLPWKLKQEMKYFRQVTSQASKPGHSNAVIMGRKTWESIPTKFRPLPNRINVILTRTGTDALQGADGAALVAHSIDDALLQLQGKLVDKIFIIGGAEIYNSVIKDARTTRVLLTEVHAEGAVEMDTFLDFPWFNEENAGWARAPRTALQSYIGPEIVLPEQDISEGSFVYNYSLFERQE
ncbi:hypothetical protein BABINDRAFT_163329 [Babjeviella inositovora NRRL Y-12698]|uniref:Dihydrofolate reductase n=1 Tax=Babjeviella inositovora NRRL Y-12698 TaxID=984486 RepID=A0A1E3QKJ0_9ASCO|nr:uncharacterized protein BABINDRAFT_163329 [Babjeviella inositovora NRRL Y-12698]ODQ77602.1 hypothetical protein BABINDRAFT_163329 [Babjeviella inositovora NRRL Y-12698]